MNYYLVIETELRWSSLGCNKMRNSEARPLRGLLTEILKFTEMVAGLKEYSRLGVKAKIEAEGII